MNRRYVGWLSSVLIAISVVLTSPPTPAAATHISCSLFSVPLAHPNMAPPPYSYGASGYAQISCNQSTTLVIWVELAINGGFSGPVRTASRNCVALDCGIETTIACCYLASDWQHTRAAGAYQNGHGQWVDLPWTTWKCYQFDPGMAPNGVTPGVLVAAIAPPEGGRASGCSGSHRAASA